MIIDTSIVFIILLAVMILIRVPVGIALIGVSFAGLWVLIGFNPAWGSLGVIPYQFSSSWVLSAVPAFLFMGYLCSVTGLTKGLFNAFRVWLSFLPGGLAVSSVFGCAGFAAISGSSVACSAAMGRIAVPEMVEAGYEPEMATSTVAASGTLGALIPPSILMIVYAVIAEVSVTKLFAQGALIGIITALVYAGLIILRVKLKPSLAPATNVHATTQEKVAALVDTWPMLAILLGTFGGLFAGVFTPTEAAAVGALLSCLVAGIKGALTIDRVFLSAIDAVKTTASIILIAVGASLFSRFLALSGAGATIQDAVLSLGADPLVIIVLIALVYLVLGMFLDPMGAMLLTLPIFLPILRDVGIDLVAFGILLAKLLEIGCLTPPIGMNVFVMKSVVGNLLTTGAIFRGVAWFVAADLLIVAGWIAFGGIL